MTIFDLLFVAMVLTMAFYAAWILTFVVRRRWRDARSHSIRWVVSVFVYLLTVLVVGIASPRRIHSPDETMRYDDWCLGVEKATFADAIGSNSPEAGMRFAIVTLRVANAAGRARQAAPRGSQVYLLDDSDERYDVSARGQPAFEKLSNTQPPLTQKLDPKSSFLTTRVFEVPSRAKELFLAHRHGAVFPGILIIGGGFRKRAVIRLQF